MSISMSAARPRLEVGAGLPDYLHAHSAGDTGMGPGCHRRCHTADLREQLNAKLR